MKSRLLILFLLPLWPWPALVIADEARWEQYMRAGVAAYRRGDYEEPVRQTKGALKEAEDFGEQDPRFATTLNNLALFSQAEKVLGGARKISGQMRPRPRAANTPGYFMGHWWDTSPQITTESSNRQQKQLSTNPLF